jgi:PhzF family phenazine biosynthesis protein
VSIPIHQVDAFTDEPFRGNPAAVCLLQGPADEGWMRAVAREMNLSETAFLYRVGGGFNLRWFTPAVEVDLCGHATLAAAHVLWETGELGRDERALFHTRGGLLTAGRRGDWIELDFPAEPERPMTGEAPDSALATALGVKPKHVGMNRLDYLVEVDSEETLKTLKPNMKSLAELPVRGVIVTCASASSEFDFASRFFALGSGIDEDPVTGSAHIGKIAWGKMNSPHIRRPNEAAAPGRGLRGNGSFSAERR